MSQPTATIAAYLEQLRAELDGEDPALIHDALYDAEEYLRAEAAAPPPRDEAEVVAKVATSFGTPREVADTYRTTERRVAQALRLPPAPRATSIVGRFFGVAADPRAYAALFYLLLSALTGVVYCGWVLTGAGVSLSLSVIVVGLPLLALFLVTLRALSLVEGRLVETLLGVRMPRRPAYAPPGALLERLRRIVADPRTWTTVVYLLLMLPLGAVYATTFAWALIFSYGTAVLPILRAARSEPLLLWSDYVYVPSLWAAPLFVTLGITLFAATLHLARLVGGLHGRLAKRLLVESTS